MTKSLIILTILLGCATSVPTGIRAEGTSATRAPVSIMALAHAPGTGIAAGDHNPGDGACGGVIKTADPSLAPELPRSPDDWHHDFGNFVLHMSEAYDSTDFAYVCDLLEAILPSMVDVLGPPVTLDTLTVELTAADLQYYACYDNTIVMDGIEPDTVTGTDASWDNLFIHELAHAFQDDILCEGVHPSWLTEGMADAARYFAAELATRRTGRDVRYRNFAARMAVYDMYDGAGEQVLGGCGTIAYRVDLDMLYLNAAGTVMVPVLAQIAAGLDDPHPLARLNEALREESNGPAPHRMYEAIDRAWGAPVDGESPPSRWMRRRSVTCPSVRDGEFVALIPSPGHNAVNPPWLHVLQFTRHSEVSYTVQATPHTVRYTGVEGTSRSVQGEWGYIETPELPAGAYRVDLQSIDKPISARSWMINVGPGVVSFPLWEGVAVVLVDDDGLPVDLPRGEITVNGRILGRVPGALFVAPYHSNLGSVTLERKGRVLGTVTATGELPRMVALPVTGAGSNGGADADIDYGLHRAPVVGWTPYHPERGKWVEVSIDVSRSSLTGVAGIDALPLDQGPLRADAAVRGSRRPPDSEAPRLEAVLCDAAGVELDREEMFRDYGVYRTWLDIPDDLTDGVLYFDDGLSTHGSCGEWRIGWYDGYEFQTSPPGSADLAEVTIVGRRLIARFDAPVDPARLALYASLDAAGGWAAVPSTPTHTDSLLFVWDLPPPTGMGMYFRGVLNGSGGAEDRILFTQFAEAALITPKLTASLPFPNPSAGVVLWRFDVTAPTDASLQVYDVLGRRVHDSGTIPLYPGVEMFRWDSASSAARAPAGVYFLRVRSAGDTFTRKVVIVR